MSSLIRDCSVCTFCSGPQRIHVQFMSSAANDSVGGALNIFIECCRIFDSFFHHIPLEILGCTSLQRVDTDTCYIVISCDVGPISTRYSEKMR